MSATSNSEAPPSLPSLDDLLADIGASGNASISSTSSIEEDFKARFETNAIKSEQEYEAHLDGVRDHYKQKGQWSCFLMWAIGGMIVGQYVLLFCVGMNYFDFTKYQWLLPVLLVQNLGQVVGLAVWAVKYLFSDIRASSPKSK